MSRTHTSIANAALDIANLAREAHALESAGKMFPQSNIKLEDMIADREEDMAVYFADIAKLLGFTVAKIEEPEYVARFFRLPTDAIQAAE